MDLPEIVCAQCGANYRHPGRAGTTKCKKCGAPMKVMMPSAAVAAPAAAVARPAAKPAAGRPTAPAKPAPGGGRPTAPAKPGAKPAARPSPARAPAASRGDDESAAAPQKKPGMNPAMLWGSVGAAVVVVAGLIYMVIDNGKKKERLEKAKAEAAAAEEAEKKGQAPKPAEAPPKPVVDDGIGLTVGGAAPPKPEGGGEAPKDAAASDAPKTPDPAGDAEKPQPKKPKFVRKEMTPFENVAGVDPAQIAKIEQLLTTMLDPNETTGATRAARELADIGKPAIPVLINRLIALDVKDPAKVPEAIALSRSLQRITGKEYTLGPGDDETAIENRESYRYAWWQWWTKNKDKFTGKSVGDDE
jgi:hypothetical protein